MANPAVWDYRDPYAWMERVNERSFAPVMISVAITGGMQGKEYSPYLPESAEEQIETVCEAYKAGAVSVHIHARDPINPTQQSNDKNLYSRINAEIRERCPGMIINNSTGGPPTLSIEEKLACLFADCKPDMASLNPGPFMLNVKVKERKEPLLGARPAVHVDTNIPVTFGAVEKTAQLMLEKGIKPEIEVFQPAQYVAINSIIQQGLIKPPYVMQFIFGFQTSIYGTPWNVLAMINDLPKNSIFYCPGVGSAQLPMNVMGILMGGHVRVGLEDNLYYKRGELSVSSAQQVERVKRLCDLIDRPVATVSQAREMLGLA